MNQQLHFSRPDTYHEIYNATNRWDKEQSLYHSFGEDRSSFGYLEYKDAKGRKDILSRVFSKKAIQEAEGLIQEKASQSLPFKGKFHLRKGMSDRSIPLLGRWPL